MKTQPKYRPDIFVLAAEIIEKEIQTYACHAICYAEFGGGYSFERSQERALFEYLFEIETLGTFTKRAEDDDDVREIRVLALLLAAEIARLKNNKK
jgi:hypothetical protein